MTHGRGATPGRGSTCHPLAPRADRQAAAGDRLDAHAIEAEEARP